MFLGRPWHDWLAAGVFVLVGVLALLSEKQEQERLEPRHRKNDGHAEEP